jgi:hypothetical protein
MMYQDMSGEFGHKNRFMGAKLRNAVLHAEARRVDRAKLYRGERLGIVAKPRKPKRKGHHGWRQRTITG